MPEPLSADRTRPGITLISADMQKNPFPLYATLRNSYPVCQVEPHGMWVVSRYDDVQFALKNPQIFSSRAFRTIHQPEWLKPECRRDYFILSQDPPQHTKHHALVNKAFVHRVINHLATNMRQRAKELAMELAGGETDFISRFTDPYVAATLGQITGTGQHQSAEEMRHLVKLTQVITPSRPDDGRVRELEDAIDKQRQRFTAAISARRDAPQSDLLGTLVATEIEGERLSDEMLISLLDLLINAGFETTSSTLAGAVIQFARQPELVTRLRADPTLIPAFVEELVRYDPPTHSVLRQTTQPITLSGVEIPENALIFILLAAANRDPERFEKPDLFELNRTNIKEHVAFGHGPHTCIGAALARLKIKIALEELLERFSSFGCPADDALQWSGALLVHAVTALPVRFQ
jgi:cytochrome P450